MNSSGEPIPQPRPYSRAAEGFEGGYDYDLDCSADLRCNDDYPEYASLEEALRSLASSSSLVSADTTDTNLLFQWTEEFVRTDIRDALGAANDPVCTQSRTSCVFRETELVYLGQGDEPPTECTAGAYSQCFARSTVTDFQAPTFETVINLDLARDKAFEELRRLLPYARNCSVSSDAGCAEVNIQQDATDDVVVNVRLNVPMSFPLNTVLGSDSVVVERTKRDVMELRRVGSTQ